MRLTPFLIVPLALFATLGDDVARQLKSADLNGQVRILEELPGRMAGASQKERAALTPLLVSIARNPERERLHAAAQRPLVMTGTTAGVREVLRHVLARPKSAVLASARPALVRDGGSAVTLRLAETMRIDESVRARALIALLLGERGDAAAGKTLLAALKDPAWMVRAAAAEALTRIYGTCVGYERSAWKPIVARGKVAAPAAPPPKPSPEKPGAPGEVVTVVPSPEEREERRTREVGRLVPEFYGIPLDREVIVVVLDFSGSVRGPGGDVVLQRLGKSLSLLPSTRRFTLLAFDERMLHLADEPLPALPDLKVSLLEFLKDLPPGQRTELLTPIRTGVAFAAEYGVNGAQVLVISDGAPTKAGPPLDDLLDRLGEIPRGRIRIDVAVHGGREVSLFRFLSRSTGGSYVALPSAK